MSYWKREYDDREFPAYLPLDRYVCPTCITDSYLANLVRAEIDEEEQCSYCSAHGAAHISTICDAVSEAIARDYVDPAEELPYDTGEGGYQGAVLSGTEIVMDEFDSWTNCGELWGDVSMAFVEGSWCRRNYFGLTRYESLHFSWQSFCKVVKHQTRYFFLKQSKASRPFDEDISPGRMVEELSKLFKEFSLFRKLPPTTDLFRARVVSAGFRPKTAAELGTAPREAARRPNRMSPAGIPMFYAAFDEETAILETYDPKEGEHEEIALARFRNNRVLHLLDLTNLPAIPSMFDPSHIYEYPRIAFLHAFERDFTKPVSRESEAHTEYVPTQVVTEYVRYHLRAPVRQRVDGILYRSSRKRGSTAVVIFAESEDCGPRTDRRPLAPKPYLELIDVQQVSNANILGLVAKTQTEPSEE